MGSRLATMGSRQRCKNIRKKITLRPTNFSSTFPSSKASVTRKFPTTATLTLLLLNHLTPPNSTGFSDPVFRARFKSESGGKEVEEDIVGASKSWIGDVFSGAAHTWDEIAHLREHWDGPILLKGIQDPEDALKAVEHKVDGVIVSNHGGRQCDGAVGSLDMLPEVVEAVRGQKGGLGGDFKVLFDSGIRTGVDVIKALCLGADMVLVGRPWVYGLGINGKIGARDALSGLLADFDQSMGLAGIQSIADCTPKMLRRVQYPGDRHSNY